jgi:cellulose biosynthesis protein BcsQ
MDETRLVTPLENDIKDIPKPTCHVISFSSLGMPWERVIFIIALAQSFSRQGYRVLIVDLDFEVPLFATSLVEYGIDLSNVLHSNDWYTGESDSSTEEMLQKVSVVTPHPLFPISIIPSSTDTGKLRKTQSMDRKAIRQAFSRISKFFRELKEEELFDIILVNTPYMNPHAINGMMTADFNFVIVDHDKFSFNLLEQYIDTMVGVYPELNVTGLILHRFQFSPAPENDVVTIALIEEQLRYPVIAKLPSLRDKLFSKLDTELWKFQNQQLQEFFETIVFNLMGFVQSPRRFKKKTKVVYYQLSIIRSGGIQLYRHTFKTTAKDLEEEEGILASAGLSSIITGTEIMISEIVRQQESAKLIEMKNVKLIIEQWKDVKIILIANLYDEQTRRRLKALVLHFVQLYAKELKNFRGDIKAFEGAKSLVEEHLLQKSTSLKKETII